MFGLFKKKGANVTDFVTISKNAKWHNLLNYWKTNPQVTFVCWFEETYDNITDWFNQHGGDISAIVLARELASYHSHGKTVLFTEHHPSKRKEEELYEKLSLKAVTVWSALEEPIFIAFGGDRIIDLMKKMGMDENDSIQHPMISNAIANAQSKIEKNLITELSARSQKDWVEKNYTS